MNSRTEDFSVSRSLRPGQQVSEAARRSWVRRGRKLVLASAVVTGLVAAQSASPASARPGGHDGTDDSPSYESTDSLGGGSDDDSPSYESTDSLGGGSDDDTTGGGSADNTTVSFGGAGSNGTAESTEGDGTSAESESVDEGYPVCSSSASDSDGDGWGWENGQSCEVMDESWGDSAEDSDSAAASEYPVCSSSASDSDGDGWGWENGQSCTADWSPPANTPAVDDWQHWGPEPWADVPPGD